MFVNNFLSTGFLIICCSDIPGIIVENSSKISKAVTKRTLIVGSNAFFIIDLFVGNNKCYLIDF